GKSPPLVRPQAVRSARESFFMESPDGEFKCGAWYAELDVYERNGIILNTPYIRAEPSRPAAAYVMGDMDQPVQTLPWDLLRAGFGPPAWFGRFGNQADSLRFRASLGDRKSVVEGKRGRLGGHSVI